MRQSTKHTGIYYRLDARGHKRYQIGYTDSDGKWVMETLPQGSSEKDAIRVRADKLVKLGRGRKIVNSKETISSLADRYMARRREQRLNPSTIAGDQWAVEHHIKPVLGHKLVRDFGADDLSLFMDTLRPQYKAWTIRGILKPLRGMLKLGIRQGLIHEDPFNLLMNDEQIKSDQDEIRILSSEEIEALLGAAKGRTRDLLTTLVYTGMRISEALELRWEDVDFAGKVIQVRQSKTKAGVRRVAVPASLIRLLAARKLAVGSEGPFLSSGGSVASRKRNALHALHTACDRAGIERVSLHALRHTCASLLIGAGADVTYVAAQLGHANPAVTLRAYAKLFDPERRMDEMRAKLEAVMEGAL